MEMTNTTVSTENITMGNATTAEENTFLQQVMQLMAYKVAMAIAKYWFKFLVSIGVIGNTLSFLVMMKPSNRKLSTCIYMASISINDNLMMFTAMYTHVSNDIKIHQLANFECKFFAFLVLMGLQSTTYQVLAMTTDKFIAIKWPHKAATYSTPRRAKIALLCVYIFVILYNIPHFFLTEIQSGICRVYIKPGLFSTIHSWLSFVVNFIIPFSLLFFMNLVIIQQVKRSHQKFGNKSNSTEGPSENNPAQQRVRAQKNVENQLTRMLVLVTSLFLILLLPTYVRFIYTTVVVIDTPEKRATDALLFHISNKFYNTNSGINFFLYCISGKKFRSDLKELLCCSGGQKEVLRKSESSGTTFSSIDGENGNKRPVFTTTQKDVWKKEVSQVGKWRIVFLCLLFFDTDFFLRQTGLFWVCTNNCDFVFVWISVSFHGDVKLMRCSCGHFTCRSFVKLCLLALPSAIQTGDMKPVQCSVCDLHCVLRYGSWSFPWMRRVLCFSVMVKRICSALCWSVLSEATQTAFTKTNSWRQRQDSVMTSENNGLHYYCDAHHWVSFWQLDWRRHQNFDVDVDVKILSVGRFSKL